MSGLVSTWRSKIIVHYWVTIIEKIDLQPGFQLICTETQCRCLWPWVRCDITALGHSWLDTCCNRRHLYYAITGRPWAVENIRVTDFAEWCYWPPERADISGVSIVKSEHSAKFGFPLLQQKTILLSTRKWRLVPLLIHNLVRTPIYWSQLLINHGK